MRMVVLFWFNRKRYKSMSSINWIILINWFRLKSRQKEIIDWLKSYWLNQLIDYWYNLRLGHSGTGYSHPSYKRLLLWLQRGSKGLSEGRKRAKNGEAKPKPFSHKQEVVSGRPLEVPTQLLWDLVRTLAAISAKARLWGTKCGSWPSLATLTCAV